MPIPPPVEDDGAALAWPVRNRRPSVAATARDDRLLQRASLGGLGWGVVAGATYMVLLAFGFGVSSPDADDLGAVLFLYGVPVAAVVGLFAGAVVGAIAGVAAVNCVRRLVLVTALAAAAVWGCVVAVATLAVGPVDWVLSVGPLATALPLAALYGRRLSRVVAAEDG